MKARPRRQMSIATAMALGELARAALKQQGVTDVKDVTFTICGYRMPREKKQEGNKKCHKM